MLRFISELILLFFTFKSCVSSKTLYFFKRIFGVFVCLFVVQFSRSFAPALAVSLYSIALLFRFVKLFLKVF